MNQRKILTALASVALAVSACGGGGSSTAPGTAAPTQATGTQATSSEAPPSAAASQAASVGEGEGELNLIAWAGYVVGGTGGEQVEGYDWVTPFEDATGCKVTVKVGVDSSNMVQLMK